LVVGAVNEDSKPIDLEISSFTKEILELMAKSLEESIKFRLAFARQDMQELQTFFENRGNTR
jgi:hypothetical protein